jgi:uncharacterized protein YigA (DUF484 family)
MFKNLIVMVLIFLSIGASRVTFGMDRKEKASEAVVVPYTVVVDNKSSSQGQVITLAVNAVTNVICPETPINVSFGNDQDLDHGKYSNRGPGLYLRPRKAGLFTNVVVEFKDGTIEFFINVVEVRGGAKSGNFTGEIVLQHTAYKNEVSCLEDQLETSKKEAGRLKEQIAELEKKASLQTQLQSQLAELKQKLVVDNTDLLKLLESSTQNYGQTMPVDFPGGHTRIRQIGRATKMEKGYVVILAVENRSGSQQTITQVRADNAQLTTTLNGARILPAHTETHIALLIEPQSETKSSPLLMAVEMPNAKPAGKPDVNSNRKEIAQVTFVVNGATATVKVTV